MKEKILIWSSLIFVGLGLFTMTLSIWMIYTDPQYFMWSWKLDLDKASDFGSFIGGTVGALWTLVGVLLLIWTFKGQQAQFQETKINSERQQFENIFFQMLNILHEIIKSTNGDVDIGYPANKKILKCEGQTFFDKAHTFFCMKAKVSIKVKEKKLNEEIDIKIKTYEEFHVEFAQQLSHYFRYIYNLFKFIVRERAEFGDANLYINLIQAQLSTAELGLIFYNALSKYGKNQKGQPQFHDWLDQYFFLENINVESLVHRNDHISYPKTDFKFLNYEERKKVSKPLSIDIRKNNDKE